MRDDRRPQGLSSTLLHPIFKSSRSCVAKCWRSNRQELLRIKICVWKSLSMYKTWVASHTEQTVGCTTLRTKSFGSHRRSMKKLDKTTTALLSTLYSHCLIDVSLQPKRATMKTTKLMTITTQIQRAIKKVMVLLCRYCCTCKRKFSAAVRIELRHNSREEEMSRGCTRRCFGRKRAKADIVKVRQNQVALRNGAIISASMKRLTVLMEEQNAIQAFMVSECTSEEDKRDREYMRLVRKAHFKATS